jgi:hypothetical protein
MIMIALPGIPVPEIDDGYEYAWGSLYGTSGGFGTTKAITNKRRFTWR